MKGRSLSTAAPPPVSSRDVPFTLTATAKDIYYCFRLLLGRYPHPEEWRGHTMRIGEDLRGVVRGFTSSLEFYRIGMAAELRTEAMLSGIEGFRIYSAADDALVGQAVRQGVYEPEVCELFRRLLRPGMNVLDLGANIGFFSLLAASLVGPTGHVLAVEPNPANARLLEASRRANGFDQLSILQVAASSANGLLVLHTTYSNGTTAGLPDDIAAVLNAQTVPALRLDDVLPSDRAVGLVKIDVEGAEYLALRGCEAMLRRDRPIIVSEFSPSLMPGISGVEGEAYLNWLTGLGYALSVLRPDGGLDRAGTDTALVMRLYAARNTDHVDILAEPLPASSTTDLPWVGMR